MLTSVLLMAGSLSMFTSTADRWQVVYQWAHLLLIGSHSTADGSR